MKPRLDDDSLNAKRALLSKMGFGTLPHMNDGALLEVIASVVSARGWCRAPETVHGLSEYRRGCRCGVCIRGYRHANGIDHSAEGSLPRLGMRDLIGHRAVRR